MNMVIRQDISWQVDKARLLRKLRLADDPADEDYQVFTKMLAEAQAIARPKFAFAVAAVTDKYATGVEVEGVRIDSELVRTNLAKTFRIIPYLATCGTELEQWSLQYDDFLENYWADELKNQALRQAIQTMRQTIKSSFFKGQDMSQMSPGSLAQWPISGQKELFTLMQEALPVLGIKLTESYLMLPAKSVSGFHFSSEHHFENCALCPMPACPERRALYKVAAPDN